MGALGFSVLRFWLFFRSVFRFFGFCAKNFGFWCSLRLADIPFFRIWFLVFAKNINGFSDLISDAVFGFFANVNVTNQLKYRKDP